MVLKRLHASLIAVAILLPSSSAEIRAATLPAETQSSTPRPKAGSPLADTGRKAGEIVTQPARDVGVATREIPPVLEVAARNPYDLTGLESCSQLTAALRELNTELGPDFEVKSGKRENRAGRLAEAGGKTVVNALIPFRGLVREISGAAPAQRRLNLAIDAGYARRGFLRGIHFNRSCRTTP